MGWADRLSEALATGEPLRLNHLEWMGGRRIRPGRLPSIELRKALICPPTTVEPRGLTIEGAQISGRLDLDYTTIPFPITFSDCRFTDPISATEAELRSLDFSGSQLSGLDLSQARLDGNLGMEGSTLQADSDGIALSLTFTQIAGGWLATDGFSAEGSIHAHGISVNGFLIMDGAINCAADGTALNLSQATLQGGWFSTGLHTRGEVTARGVAVGGPLCLDGSTFRNPGGVALNVELATFSGGFFAMDGFSTEGEVLASGLQVDGQLNLDGATLSNFSDVSAIPGHTDGRVALRLEQATITGTWFARNGFHADGEVRISRVNIGGQLDLSGATICNPGGHAISLTQTRIDGDWLTARGFSADGEVSASGVNIDGHLNLEEARLSGDLHLAEVTASRFIAPKEPPSGRTYLEGCEFGAIATSDNPPPLGAAAGLQVKDLYGPMREDPGLTISWLRDAPWFISQPWEELAKVYSRNGQPNHARRVRVAAAREITRHAGPWSRLARMVHGATVGYGYHPLWALAWIGAVFVVVGLIASCTPGAFVATSTAAVTFDPWVYALAAIGPASAVVDSGWEPSAPGYAWLLYVLTLLKVASWVLTALFLAGITGLLKRDHI